MPIKKVNKPKKPKKPKKSKKLYDDDGHWVEERPRVKGSIRRAFRPSPQMREVLLEARVELPPALKKDGTPGKRPQVRYRCAMCRGLFPMKSGKSSMVQVDHIENVVPLWIKETDMTYDEIVRGVFCNKSNLQVLCSVPLTKNNGKPSCHRKKTNEENWIRKRFETSKLTETVKEMGITSKAIDHLKAEYQEYLAEKEAKKNARRNKKSRKRKTDSSAD